MESLLTWAEQELARVCKDDGQIKREYEALSALYRNDGAIASEAQREENFKRAVTRRSRENYPLAYLTGETVFYGLRMFVSSAQSAQELDTAYKTYVPRPETELLVSRALEVCQQFEYPRVVDIATGSGCIPVAIAKNYPDAGVTAVEISSEALKVARRNADENGVALEFLQGSWFEPVLDRQFDIVVCNPPYVPEDGRDALTPEAQHEPEQSHHPDTTPEELYEQLFEQTARVLAPEGSYFFEMGFGQFGSQSFDVLACAQRHGLTAEIISDHEGTPRFILGRHQA